MGEMNALIFDRLRTERPNAKQLQFFNSNARYTLYGGARGGGKSWAVRRKAVLLCMRYNGIKVLIVRRTFRELQNNHVKPLMTELNGYARYRDADKTFTFPGGSEIIMGYCDCDNDMYQYQGCEYDVIFFDEATLLKEEWIVFIASALRSVSADFRTRIYYTANPGGASHAYFKRLFIDRVYRGTEKPEDYLFIPATVYDNTILMERDPDYLKQLEALPEAKKRAHLYGEWDVFEGAFFAEFVNSPSHYADRRYTHVIPPFDIPDGWRIYRSFDWGYARPFDLSYWAVGWDGEVYLIYQWYGCRRDAAGNALANQGLMLSPDEVFRHARQLEDSLPLLRGKQIFGVADPAIWQANGGISVAETAEKYGVTFDKGDNARIAGWMQIHERMQFRPDGRPMIYFFNTCTDAIRTLPLLQYDAHRQEDLDTSQEDHFADSMRYFCMYRPLKPKENVKEEERKFNPLEKRRF